MPLNAPYLHSGDLVDIFIVQALTFKFEPVNGVVKVLGFDVSFSPVFVSLKTPAERGYRLNGGERYYPRHLAVRFRF